MPKGHFPRKPKATCILNGVRMSKLKQDRILAFKAQLPQLDERERLNAEDIAARLNLTTTTIRTWLRVLGHNLHNRLNRRIYKHDTTGWEKKILPVYEATDYNAAETARRLGMDKSVVFRWLANNGHRHPDSMYADRDISTFKFQNYR
jgi:hypothetical protein